MRNGYVDCYVQSFPPGLIYFILPLDFTQNIVHTYKKSINKSDCGQKQ